MLHWNSPATALRAVRSALDAAGVEVSVTVLDNDSDAEAAQQLKAELPPGVTFIQNGTNLGYAGGMNLLLDRWLETASEDALCVLLAHDVVLATDALHELAKAARGHPGYGILGPAVTYGKSDDKVSLGAAWGRWRGSRDRRVPPDRLRAQELLPADWVNGATLLLRAACLRAIGGFNSDLFAYWEDVDLCLRAARQGWKVGVVTSAHTHATTRIATSDLAAYFGVRNELEVARLHGGAPAVASALARSLGRLPRPLAGALAPWRPVERRTASKQYARAIVRGVHDFRHRRLGAPAQLREASSNP